jgi:hypothetical protein
MISESARMSSAAEARFRVQAPNSLPRATTIIALDALGEAVAARLAQGAWNHASFFSAAGGSNGESPDDGRLRTLAGDDSSGVAVQDQVDTADLVVMIAGAEGHASAAATIGAACSRTRVNTTALIVGSDEASEPALARTLAQVRPWSLMVVLATDDTYIDDMLTALRA